MKLPKFKKKDKRTALEKERDAYVETMWAHRDDAEEYSLMCENAEVLSAAAAEGKNGPDWVEVAKVGVPVFGTIAICITNWLITKRVTTFEETDVITSKATQFKVPWK